MYRNKEIKIRLTEKELQRLDRNVAKTSTSREGYVRTLIFGYAPQSAPPQAYWDKVRSLWAVVKELEGIALSAGRYDMALGNTIASLNGRLAEITAGLQSINTPKKLKD